MNKNIILLHFSSVLAAFAPLFAKSVQLSADVIIWWRCLFAFMLLGGIRLITKPYKILPQYLPWVLFSGIFLGLHWWTYFLAIQYSSVAIGILALFTFPLITAILEPFLSKTKAILRQILGGIGIVMGVYFLIPEFSLENNITQGVFLGVLSAFIYTLRNIITKKHLAEVPAMTTLNYQLFFAFLILSIPLFFSLENFTIPPTKDLGLILLLASFFTIGSHGLIVYSLKNFTASTVSIVGSLQVVYSTALAFILLSEVPNTSFFIGSVIIMSIAIYELLPHKTKI